MDKKVYSLGELAEMESARGNYTPYHRIAQAAKRVGAQEVRRIGATRVFSEEDASRILAAVTMSRGRQRGGVRS
jgi:hypothetical protein